MENKKNRKYNILILGMGSNVSQGIFKALHSITGVSLHIVGACISKSSVGLFMCDESVIMPLAGEDGFVTWYINICNDKNIDMVFTGVEENIDALVRNREFIEKSCNAKFVYPEEEIWNIGFDKYDTCQWLKKNGIPYPDFALASDDKGLSELIMRVGFPLIAKPRRGKSSAGIITAHSLKDLMAVIGNDEYVVQECVGDEDSEYTIGCYFTMDGALKSKITLHRYLKNGTTSIAEIVQDKDIDKVIDMVADNIKTRGPLNIQMRKRFDGTPVCFEWNVRYSGATAIRNHFGFRDVEAALREDVLSENIDDCFEMQKSGFAIRYDAEMYFPDRNLKEVQGEW
ncbi:MAG: hypothetical protein K6E62_07550 [Lachnospiraceae bacterium]|nr:hypothetical protein [Lachnospiraceae bacterium]